jgi:hypothetical protein
MLLKREIQCTELGALCEAGTNTMGAVPKGAEISTKDKGTVNRGQRLSNFKIFKSKAKQTSGGLQISSNFAQLEPKLESLINSMY